MKRRTESQARSVLRERLRARREEIAAAALARANGIADPGEAGDPAYAQGLRTAVDAALDYALEALEGGESEPPVPIALLAQARLAARSGVSLDTVLRRYFAGYSLLGYFLLEEARSARLMDGADWQRLLGAQAGNFDRLIAAVGEEHRRESATRRTSSSERRQAELIERLLAGEMVDRSELAYDFDGWHIGIAASGTGAADAVRALARTIDCRLLPAGSESEAEWAWLGSLREPDPKELLRIAGQGSASLALALGEPGEGLQGWRLTHRQATAALPLAERGPVSVVRYRDVALLAAVHRDELLVTSLCRLYLAPLERERDGGASARETLRHYFGSGRNVSSAAAALGVTRNTVANRLRAIEDMINQPLLSCAPELEVALRADRSHLQS